MYLSVLLSVLFLLTYFSIYLSRLYLAAMHFNENADREQAMNLEGKAVYRIMYPKSKKGQPTVKSVKTEPTFGLFINVFLYFF